MTPSPLIWINSGEPSGDMHGALLVNALRTLNPEVRITGMGGSLSIAAGQDHVAHIKDLSVMGFTEVLGQLPKIIGLLRRIKQAMRAARPDVVVLIDAPDFNFRVAAIANDLGIPVVYYISPKLWAWRKGRARFIKRRVKRMLCILPFEVDFYSRYGVHAEYVGNPLLDAIDWPRVAHLTPDATQIGILPGSRPKELRSLLPAFAETARLLHAKRPELHFTLGRAPGVEEQALRAAWPQHVPLRIVPPEERHGMMRTSALCIAASGTVTLETALLQTPTIVAYKLSNLTFALARRVVRVPFISLPNLIMGRGIFPEHLQEDADAPVLAQRALSWLEQPAQLREIRNSLLELRAMMGEAGAPARAARAVLETCAG